ncbi:MAG: serpin family protein [Melioribacteraceae bacterium]|nr:serpin family protein [Melioribacteraceae bacterium]
MGKLKVILASMIIICAGCETSSQYSDEVPIRELTRIEKQLVSSADNFSLKIFKKIAEAEQEKNVFISPLSISMALGMTLNGAEGETYDAMRRTLSLADITQQETNESYQSLIELLTKIDREVIMQIANSIWYRNTIQVKQNFIETNQKYFNATINPMNFGDPATINIINNWVKESTNGKIDKIVEKIDAQTIMFLINAIYFKGTWKYQFDKNKTRDDLFTKQSGEKVPCKMMNLENDFYLSSNDTFTVIDLPYGKGNFSMTILLPDKDKSLNDVLNSLTDATWSGLISNLVKMKKELYMPRFKLEYKLNLNNTLKALGMSVAFDPYGANFKKLYDGSENAYISNVEHKTFVDVNEEGTEAAAVTSVEIGLTSIMDTVIRLDRPFIFVIREKNSNCILFIGKLEDPS